ncbi:heavy metal-associated isoprenylated plant protein 3-like isoform X2 [Durio zibethinus]|uniref:Heavy metal-associated isoprenylated plant protein 3-like isoform X2 n=1 Tax=Durio zibethinus TaxID=66656 RepID=A0A6P5ZSA3_DURZI|nr:heavy metal-associated isoprenylated plant protein 3-like isoform X2 [Durio zibethinus]
MGKNGKDGENKKKGSLTVVLKVYCLCKDCISQILSMDKLEGVETVIIESSSKKVTVIGAVEPTAIKEKLVKKTKKKVDLISPQPKKDDNKKEKTEKKPDKEKNKDSDNKRDKKPKEASVMTVDLKVQLKCQCQGCIDKISKIVDKTKGVHGFKIDKEKELITVKGTMDVKALADALKDKLKNVEIVPPKKKKDGNNEGGKNGDNNNKKKNKGGNGGGEGGNKVNASANSIRDINDISILPNYSNSIRIKFEFGSIIFESSSKVQKF